LSSASDAVKNKTSVLTQPIDMDKNDPNLLVNSPFAHEPHLLDLRSLDLPNQFLAKALNKLICLRKDYATAPYVESFNWSEIIDGLRKLVQEDGFAWKEQPFYIVVFRSRILPETDRADLGALDKAAHAEAMESGGLLKYWFGTPDENGRNLATCVWRRCQDARAGSVGKDHVRAANAARRSYSEWRTERLRLLIKDDVEGWEISKWVD